ncbi:MAG TPA: TetR family transcriptional regulator [Acidimicrobiales bacterium]
MAPSTTPTSSRARGTHVPAHRDSGSTKRRILDAAEQVVLRDGVGHLTLEAAAAEAGLSKGGVLYHYPSRDALVAAMVTRIIQEFEEDIAAYLPEPGSPEAGRPGAYARAYVRATLAPAAPGQERLGAALLAAAAAEPELLIPLQEAADGWQARLVDDGLDPALATVIRLACDGLWLCDLFGLASPQGPLRAQVGSAVEQMTVGQGNSARTAGAS